MPEVELHLLPASTTATPTCRLRLLRHWQHCAAFQVSTTLLLHLLLNVQEHHQIPHLQLTPTELYLLPGEGSLQQVAQLVAGSAAA